MHTTVRTVYVFRGTWYINLLCICMHLPTQQKLCTFIMLTNLLPSHASAAQVCAWSCQLGHSFFYRSLHNSFIALFLRHRSSDHDLNTIMRTCCHVHAIKMHLHMHTNDSDLMVVSVAAHSYKAIVPAVTL